MSLYEVTKQTIIFLCSVEDLINTDPWSIISAKIYLTPEAGTFGDYLVELLKVGSSRAGCWGPCCCWFLLFLSMQTLQPLWTTCASVWLLLEQKLLMFKWSFLCFSLWLLPLVLPLGSTEKSLAQSLFLPIKYLYTLIRLPSPRSSLLQVKQYQHPQPVLISGVLQSPHDREPLSWKNS